MFCLLTSCITIKETESTASREYCLDNYRTNSFIVSMLDEKKYYEIFTMLKNRISSNNSISDDIKKKDLQYIQSVDFANNRTLYFEIPTDVILAEKDFNFTFSILDENNKNIIEKIDHFFLKTTYYTNNKPFAGLDFSYYWIIITKRKITKNSKWTLVVKFPNKSEKKYLIKSI